MDRIAADLIIFWWELHSICHSLSHILLPTAEKCQNLHLNWKLFICIFLIIQLICLLFFSSTPPISSFAMQWNSLLLVMLLLVCVCVNTVCVCAGMEQRWVKVESEKRQRCKWELDLLNFNASRPQHKDELEANLCSRGRTEPGREGKTGKKSPLISSGEQRWRSTDLWTGCHHLNIEPSVTSTHAHTGWGSKFNSTVAKTSAKYCSMSCL